MRWGFKCRYCGSLQTVARKAEGTDISFDDESPRPGLQNLATHLTKCKKKPGPGDDSEAGQGRVEGGEKFNLEASVKLMQSYMKEGLINPEIVATQKGFYRIFAAWILDESLPWTTGESPSLAALFKYLRVRFSLPTDTTVRNYLTHIFVELHETIVNELKVSSFGLGNNFLTYQRSQSVKSKISYATDTWTTKQMVHSFACTLACFIDDDWRLIERVVDFRPLESKDHEGINAAKVFVQGGRERGSLNKMSTRLSRYSISSLSSYLPVNPALHEPDDR